MKRFKDAIWSILNLTFVGPLLQIQLVGYLKDYGWPQSFKTKKSIDKDGNGIPWFTYPFTDFLRERLKGTETIFEFGCGDSTNWLAKRSKSITAVEDFKGWADYVKKNALPNVKIIEESTEDKTSYPASVTKQGLFDIIIIDGKLRNECISMSAKALTEIGVIILDDSQRKEYDLSKALLKKLGFKELNFWGMHPVTPYTSCTSLYYRPKNCFDI